jgi:hypothetical protein
MTRVLPFAAAALLTVSACSSPDAPRATATPVPVSGPVAVFVLVPESPEPEVAAWGQALVAAITSGQGGLVLAPTLEEAAAVVRIDAVEVGVEASPEPEGEGEISVMRGALVLGETARPFDLAYRGEAGPQAEALARNLRRFVTEGGTGPPAAAPVGTDETEAPTEGPS